MQPLSFTLEFTGEAVELADGRFWAETRADGEPLDGGEALCRRDLEVRSDGSLVQAGEIRFGGDDAIIFRADGVLGPSPDPALRHGAAVFEITGGRGRLEGARGFVTSNFLLADSGELTDRQLGLLFLEEREAQTCESSS